MGCYENRTFIGLVASVVVIGLMKKKRFEIDDKLDILEKLE